MERQGSKQDDDLNRLIHDFKAELDTIDIGVLCEIAWRDYHVSAAKVYEVASQAMILVDSEMTDIEFHEVEVKVRYHLLLLIQDKHAKHSRVRHGAEALVFAILAVPVVEQLLHLIHFISRAFH
ncbi:MAG: hypothetical protein M3R02_23335 [Chloroflexota bacterium]|nr:hypothetical protein [Chloroflexota bacterium]